LQLGQLTNAMTVLSVIQSWIERIGLVYSSHFRKAT
jgi:hypothetical protein